jgi:anti-sigma factor RsiW
MSDQFNEHELRSLWEQVHENRPCENPIDLAAFVDGILTDSERESAEAHLSTCRACREALVDVRGALADPVDAPQDVIDAAKQLTRGRIISFPLRWVGVAAALVFVVVALLLLQPKTSGPAPVETPEVAEDWVRSYQHRDRVLMFDAGAVAPDGSIYVVGASGDEEYRLRRLVVSRMRADGSPEWTIDVTARREITEAADVLVTADGGCLAVGQLDAELYAIRCSAAGEVLWTRALGTEVFDNATGVAELEDGSFGIVGSISLFDGTTRRGFVSERVVLDGYVATWVVRISADGELLWEQALDVSRPNRNGPMTFPTPTITRTSDGGMVVAAVTDYAPNGPADVWVARLDRDGQIHWQKTLGSNGLNGIQTVTEAANGDLLLGGSIANDAATQVRGWIGRMADDGRLLWQREMTSESHYLLGGSVYERPDGTIDYVSMAARSEAEKSTGVVRFTADGNLAGGWVLPAGERKIFGFSMHETAQGVVLIGYSAETISETKILRGWISGHSDVSRTWDALPVKIRDGGWTSQDAQFFPADVDIESRDVAAPMRVAPVRCEPEKN